MTLVALALGAALAAGPPAPAGDAPAAWSAFVDAPTHRRYQRVAQAVGACGDASCARAVAPDPAVVARLLKLIDVGQPLAVDAAMEAYRFLDGALLEDVSRALGAYSDAHPVRFLRTAMDHRLPAAALQRIVRTLPRAATLDAAERSAAVERRIQSLSRADDPELAPALAIALDALRAPAEGRREARRGVARGR